MIFVMITGAGERDHISSQVTKSFVPKPHSTDREHGREYFQYTLKDIRQI